MGEWKSKNYRVQVSDMFYRVYFFEFAKNSNVYKPEEDFGLRSESQI